MGDACTAGAPFFSHRHIGKNIQFCLTINDEKGQKYPENTLHNIKYLREKKRFLEIECFFSSIFSIHQTENVYVTVTSSYINLVYNFF